MRGRTRKRLSRPGLLSRALALTVVTACGSAPSPDPATPAPAVTAEPRAPAVDQGDSIEAQAEALAVAIDHVLSRQRRSAGPHILLDTLRTAADLPEHHPVVERVVRILDLRSGVSEDHCARVLLVPEQTFHQVGLEVRGVDAIVTAGFDERSADSAVVWVSVRSGAGPYLAGGESYALARDSSGWRIAEPRLMWSHGMCTPRRYDAALVLAARDMLARLGASGGTCLDPTGFPVWEKEQVAEALGAEIHGQYVPPVRPGAAVPEPYRDPCWNAGAQWGSILKFLRIEWPENGLLRVDLEGLRLEDGQAAPAESRRLRYTLREAGGGWTIEEATPAGPIIRPDGIGAARRGMTVGELRRALSPGTELGPVVPFMVDIAAAPVVAGADTLYRVLFVGLDSIDDALPLELLATQHPAARTVEGVGPGATLAEAAAIYGPATLSYSVHDESREYAAFEGQPEGLRFRVRPTGDAFFAGAYDDPGEFATTTTYDPSAVIWMVMVDLLR